MTDSLPTPDNDALAIAREIARLRVASDDQARASQANRRSVELNGNNGVNYYRDGELVGGLGTTVHGDLVFFRDPVYSPIPPPPAPPLVEGIIGGISIVWDGAFTDGSQWNDGIAAVHIHAVQNINDPISELTQIHTFPTKAGGAFFYAVEPSVGELYFILESISVAGNSAQGPASAGATAIPAVDPAQWQEHEDALENLNTVVLPALQADLDANTETLDNFTTVTLPALNADLAEAAEAVAALESRGTDLIVNGTGALGTNKNFTALDLDPVDVPTGAVASFKTKTTAQQSVLIDDLLPFNPSKDYRYAWKARQTVPGSTDRMYGFIAPYDAQKRSISPYMYMFQANTTTTLAAPLNPGDTTITLTSSANWYGSAAKPAGASPHLRTIIIWGWVDENGKTWPAFTYSRNYKADAWADGSLVGNVITLRAPWDGPAVPAGRQVSNGSSGGSFIYTPTAQNVVVPEDWTFYSQIFDAGIMADATAASGRSSAQWTTGVPPGTALIKTGWLANYPPSPANAIEGQHSFASVSFSDAAAGQGWRVKGKTTIDGGNVEADSITAIQLAANSIVAAKILAGAVIAGKIAADAVTAVTIAADAVTAVKIAAGAVVAGKIAADAVTATTIAAGAVVAGKIAAGAVTATTIAAGAVTAVKIAAGAITAGKIAAGSVTATELNSEVLKAGFVLTGSIQVGNITITASGGIIVPQTGGGSIRLPADGSSALFDGNITARSITVVNNLTLLGGNNTIAGQLTLSAGVTAPSVGPSMYRTWPSVYGETLDGSDSPWRDHIGMAQHPSTSTWFATAVIFGGTAIRYVNETTGALAQIPDPTNGQAWCAGFYAWGGLGFYNGSYYLYGQDSNRDNAWFIYRINATTMAKISDVLVTTDEYFHADGYPTITCGTDGNVHIFYAQGVNGRHRWYNASLAFLNDVVYNNYGIPVNHDAAYMGNADMGSAYWFLAINETKAIVAFNSSNVYDATNSFGYAEGTPLRGLMFDATTSRFKSFDKNGMLYSYSSHKADQIVTATNTWYDSVGTTRETTPSPAVQFTIPARSHLVVETGVPPDSGNTDAGLVDKANQTKVYVGVGAGGTRRLQGGGSLGLSGADAIRTITLDAINTGSAVAPAANGFAAVAATGSLVSAAESGGVPILTIDGSGKINNQIIEDTGWLALTLVNGWTNAGSPSANARYRRRNGVVYLEGVIVPGTNAAAAGCATLPVGFRPGSELRKSGDTNSLNHNAGRFDIQTGGVIKPQAAVTWLDISCSFLPA